MSKPAVDGLCGRSGIARPPIFRYDKSFQGKVITESGANDVEVAFRARPWGMNLAYDRPKVEYVLREADAFLELVPEVRGVRA